MRNRCWRGSRRVDVWSHSVGQWGVGRPRSRLGGQVAPPLGSPLGRSSPQLAASLAFLALAAGSAVRGRSGASPVSFCRWGAWRGHVVSGPTENVGGGGAGAGWRTASTGTHKHDRGPQERSAGGGCRSTRLVRDALSRKAEEVSAGWRPGSGDRLRFSSVSEGVTQQKKSPETTSGR
jgi:hypothetical protein